jgi:flagellar basal body-associated protein FliL
MIKPIQFLLRIAATALSVSILILSIGHSVDAAEKKKKVKDEASWIVPTHIQLNPLMVPVKGRRTAPITIYIEAADKKFVGNICNYVPRMRDAVLTVLSRKPIRVKGRKLILKGLPRQLLGPMNKSIGNKVIGKRQIKDVYVVAGAVRMGGGSISRLPFARINGCQSVRRAEADRMKAKAAQKEH